MGFADGNGDGYPEFTWVEKTLAGSSGMVSVKAMDLRNHLLVKAGWGFSLDESLPMSVSFEEPA